jgi:uncharacterized protein (DUF2336 family)
MNAHWSLVADLESAVDRGSFEGRVNTLSRVTDLFINNADRLNEQQVGVFDEVLQHFVKHVDGVALAELSARLGIIENAPVRVVQHLARYDDIAIAEPILTHSPRLRLDDLVEISNTKSQAHLLAISGRKSLNKLVTDVLLQRGNRNVVHRLADNQEASFSHRGYTQLMKYSAADGELATKVGGRMDLSMVLRHHLPVRATDSAGLYLLSGTNSISSDRMKNPLVHGSKPAPPTTQIAESGHVQAQRMALALHSKGKLNESALFDFAKAGQRFEVIASLALLCGAPFSLVATVLQREPADACLIPCRAAGLRWPTVRMILVFVGQARGKPITAQDLDHQRMNYAGLTQSRAQRVLHSWRRRRLTASLSTRPGAIEPEPQSHCVVE